MARFAQIILALNVLLFLGFGLAYLIWPARMAGVPGIILPSAEALTDVRAIYGGMEIGIAAFLAWCLRAREEIRTGLLVATLALAGIAFGRAVGIAVDGPAPLSLRLLLAEGFGAVANAAVLLIARKALAAPQQ